MYSVRVNYGIDQTRKVFLTEKELKKAFRSKEDFDKFIDKLDKETRKDVPHDHTS